MDRVTPDWMMTITVRESRPATKVGFYWMLRLKIVELLRRMHSAYRHLQPHLAANLKMAFATNASLIFGDFPIPVPFPPSSLPSVPLLPHCRSLFTVASGRSGTGWTASLLGKFSFIEIEKEPASSCGTQIQMLLRVEPKTGFFGSYQTRIKSVLANSNSQTKGLVRLASKLPARSLVA